jgi:hypothetical protein
MINRNRNRNRDLINHYALPKSVPNDTLFPCRTRLGVSKKEYLSKARALWPCILFTLLPSGLMHCVMLIRVDLASPQSCDIWFKTTSFVIGFSTALGTIFQYVFCV